MDSKYIVTHLVTGYGSTHDALDTVVMSDLATLTALGQSLVATVESQGAELQKVLSALDNISRISILDSAQSAGTDVQVCSVVPSQESHDRVMPPSSTLRDLGKDIPILTVPN